MSSFFKREVNIIVHNFAKVVIFSALIWF